MHHSSTNQSKRTIKDTKHSRTSMHTKHRNKFYACISQGFYKTGNGCLDHKKTEG